MKIIRFEASNFKRVRAVEITPNGALVVVGGKNAQGKSSTLDAIQAAFGGAGSVPKDAMRHGAKRGHVAAETDEFTVRREFGPNGKTALVVTGKDGHVFASPQAMLDKLVGSISFDPLAFTRMKPAEQAELLRKLAGLDFSQWDAVRKAYFDQRTDINREAKRLQGALGKLPPPDSKVPVSAVPIGELIKELQARQLHNVENARAREMLDKLRKRAQEIEEELEKINRQGVALKAQVDAMVDQDIAGLQEQIANAEKTGAAVQANARRVELSAELDTQIEKSEALTKRIEEIDGLKADAIAKAEYPVDGIEARDDGAYFRGVPLDQASQAEKISVSVAIGAKLNPQLRVLLVRDGSLLDADSLKALADLAEENDLQVWLERVSDDGKGCTVLIEDGVVAGAEVQS